MARRRWKGWRYHEKPGELKISFIEPRPLSEEQKQKLHQKQRNLALKYPASTIPPQKCQEPEPATTSKCQD